MLLWKRHVVTTCSDMDFCIGSAPTATKYTTTVVNKRPDTNKSSIGRCCCCCVIVIQFSCVLLVLLNDAKWRCAYCCWASQHRAMRGTNSRVWTDKCVVPLSTWHVTLQWHGAVWIIQQRHLRTRQGWWRRVLGRPKHACQKIFQSQLLCFCYPC